MSTSHDRLFGHGWPVGRLTEATIRHRNLATAVCHLRYGEKLAHFPLTGNATMSCDGDLKQRFQ